MRYVSRARVGRAGVLLGDCSTTLEVVAARTGFESAASLSRAFKRYFGMSPGMYRRAGNGGNASQRS
jgi:transcriptional regulator GlxA family with amidase domain